MLILFIEQWDVKGVLVWQGYGMIEVGFNLFFLYQVDVIWKKGLIGWLNFYV